MPSVKCLCGALTNTAVSDAWEHGGKEAHECYAAWDENEEKWVKGCAYDRVNPLEKPGIDDILLNKPQEELDWSLWESDEE